MRMAKSKLVVLALLVLLALTNLGVFIPTGEITNVTLTNVVFLTDDCTVSFDTSFDYDVTKSYGMMVYTFGDGTPIRTSGATWNTSGAGSLATSVILIGAQGPYENCTLTVSYLADGYPWVTRTVSTESPEVASTPWFFTPESADDLTTGNHQTVLYNGVEACGVFESGWYGRKYLTPENFPACTEFLPDGVEVACMNEEAIWTTDNVTGSGVSEGVFYAVVEQHGTCGIFPVS